MNRILNIRWQEKIASVVAGLILVIGLTVAVPECARGYYNLVWNQTGSVLSVTELDGFKIGISPASPGNYGYDVRSVWVEKGKCYRFVGPGVNQRVCPLKIGYWKSVGGGTWWVQKG